MARISPNPPRRQGSITRPAEPHRESGSGLQDGVAAVRELKSNCPRAGATLVRGTSAVSARATPALQPSARLRHLPQRGEGPRAGGTAVRFTWPGSVPCGRHHPRLGIEPSGQRLVSHGRRAPAAQRHRRTAARQAWFRALGGRLANGRIRRSRHRHSGGDPVAPPATRGCRLEDRRDRPEPGRSRCTAGRKSRARARFRRQRRRLVAADARTAGL